MVQTVVMVLTGNLLELLMLVVVVAVDTVRLLLLDHQVVLVVEGKVV
jgi:hypothetical protein